MYTVWLLHFIYSLRCSTGYHTGVELGGSMPACIEPSVEAHLTKNNKSKITTDCFPHILEIFMSPALYYTPLELKLLNPSTRCVAAFAKPEAK